jgi:Domain of unknown function (DUF362)
MSSARYRSLDMAPGLSRREFVKAAGVGSAAAGALVLAPMTFGQAAAPPPAVQTNIADFQKVPRTPRSIPGPFPGKVVKVTDTRSVVNETFDAKVIAEMVARGITTLTGRNLKDSFRLLIDPRDVVGLKVNPVGPPLINTRPEVAEAVIAWLVDNGIPRSNIVIWDRFDYMLKDAGFTKARFPGIALEGLQTMDEAGNRWRGADGRHLSIDNFDQDVYYEAKGALWTSDRNQKNEDGYLNQHVFNGERSFFGKLLTKRLTRIINLAAYKNTGPGISMATKNLGYGSICNTGRLHAALGLQVNTEVLAAPVLRDKLALNVTDGLRAQYDGGPDKNGQFVYDNHALYFATDPFALDMMCHQELAAVRKAKGVTVNDNPRFSEYLRYAETLGLGVVAAHALTIVKV